LRARWSARFDSQTDSHRFGSGGVRRRPAGFGRSQRIAKRRGAGEGSIYRRADGRWAGTVSLESDTGRRVRKTVYGRTRKEVAEKLGDVQARVAKGRPPTNAPS
jgi:hypothetical protein